MSQQPSNESDLQTDVEDLPLVALLTEPFHDKSEADQDALIERMRALRNNAAKARSETKKTSNKISIIGGESIYKEFLPLANKLLITEINITVEGADTFFPAWKKQEWAENSRINSIESGIEYSFVEYLRD